MQIFREKQMLANESISGTAHWLCCVKIAPFKRFYLKKKKKSYFVNPFYEAENKYLYSDRLFSPLGSQLLPTPQSHVLTETCWSVPGSQQLKPIEREIPS